MKKSWLWLIFAIGCLEAHMFHQEKVEGIWQVEEVAQFDELMISWNAPRPQSGKFSIYASVKIGEWSPWLLYATWGSEGQSSYSQTCLDVPVRVYQDALEVLGPKADGFRIQVLAEGDAQIADLRLHAYTNSDKNTEVLPSETPLQPLFLSVPSLSQIVLNHPRCLDLCSPTSTTAVSRFLSEKDEINPIEFAQGVWDSGFDIFGNWVFNVAQASVHLGSHFDCWVERLSGFQAIYERLSQGTPVVVSVRGPLPGSAAPYPAGHLIVVTGYDPEQDQVICMDPAFPTDCQARVGYDRSDFLTAWSRRGKVAYVFSQR